MVAEKTAKNFRGYFTLPHLVFNLHVIHYALLYDSSHYYSAEQFQWQQKQNFYSLGLNHNHQVVI